MKEIKSKSFANGSVYLLKTDDGYPLEVTDTFLPYYTKDAIGRKQNLLDNVELGDRTERWMIGVSTMSGCPVRCKFCATAKLKRWCNLTAQEILDQVDFIVGKNNINPSESKEFKINYTRMGEFGLNSEEIKKAIKLIDSKYPNVHHFISTIGIKGTDFSWITGNVTLQISVHSLDEKYRDWLIPYNRKMTLKELSEIRTNSNNKTTINLTLTNEEQLDVDKLRSYFDPEHFFIKLSPLNENYISDKNHVEGVIVGHNLV